jgi:hypothetical protein
MVFRLKQDLILVPFNIRAGGPPIRWSDFELPQGTHVVGIPGMEDPSLQLVLTPSGEIGFTATERLDEVP